MRLGAARWLVGMWERGCFLTSILQGVFVKNNPSRHPPPPGWRGADGLGGRAAGEDGPLCGWCWGDGEASEEPAPPPGAGGTVGRSVPPARVAGVTR